MMVILTPIVLMVAGIPGKRQDIPMKPGHFLHPKKLQNSQKNASDFVQQK